MTLTTVVDVLDTHQPDFEKSQIVSQDQIIFCLFPTFYFSLSPFWTGYLSCLIPFLREQKDPYGQNYMLRNLASFFRNITTSVFRFRFRSFRCFAFSDGAHQTVEEKKIILVFEKKKLFGAIVGGFISSLRQPAWCWSSGQNGCHLT